MEKHLSKFLAVIATLALGALFLPATTAFADEGEDATNAAATSISISPVSKILQLSPSTTYEDSFTVTNNGDGEMDFEVYASPYSYTYSEEEDLYKLGFNHENSYTQITRWVTFRDANGNYVEKTTYKAQPNSSVEVAYRIVTPSSIPAGGQYAVLFAHTLSGSVNASGIKTEASPGLVIYGRAEGDTVVSSEISNLQINQTMGTNDDIKNVINATSKVKNTGNVDFMASGKLKVQGIFGFGYYETATTSTRARISVIPESELTVGDSWDETPFFGLFHVTWTVEAAGNSETTERMVLILPPVIIVIMILLLTIITIWIIISVRKRKERRSRFMV